MKHVEFKDGSKISYNPTNDQFKNTLIGTITHLLIGKCEYRDEVNNVYGFFELGKGSKRQAKDYL